MREIVLTNGMITQVDDCDFALLSKRKWQAKQGQNTWYAVRSDHVRMHRLILDAPSGIEVDHIDGNGLNNQRCNLRLATKDQNQHNSVIRSDNTSGLKGVHLDKRSGSWVAQITVRGKTLHLGCFVKAKDAARRYDDKARELFGGFAKTNFD
jgi:hypothetical protein